VADSKFMVAWKQSNNGTTFVASPRQLHHLGNPRSATFSDAG
jgi:hypothetical protein